MKLSRINANQAVRHPYSLSTAIEREKQETLETRSNIVGGIVGSIATIDQNYEVTDKREFIHTLWGLLRLDDDSFNVSFPAGKKPDPQPEGGEMAE